MGFGFEPGDGVWRMESAPGRLQVPIRLGGKAVIARDSVLDFSESLEDPDILALDEKNKGFSMLVSQLDRRHRSSLGRSDFGSSLWIGWDGGKVRSPCFLGVGCRTGLELHRVPFFGSLERN